MFESPSLVLRIAIGKVIGLVIGLIGFIILPLIMPEADPYLRWGVLLWYITFGAIIGVFGVFTYHPVLKLPMPWWVRAPLMGAWLNFVLSLIAYDKLLLVMQAVFGEGGFIASPFWLAAEGTFFGFLIGYFATKFGGEGQALLKEQV